MSSWTRQKRETFEAAFYEFLGTVYINSKDLGKTCLGDNIYEAQRRFISTVLDGLEEDIHNIYVLKSRQLGLSTISRAFTVFYLGMHDGLGGATVFDTDENKNNARREIESMITNLPKSIQFPRIKGNNRGGIFLQNESGIRFMAAGVKKSKSSGVLGRSVGLSFAHCSELCSWDAGEGVEAFINSLSEENPDRLYIWESTARGFNLWHELWTTAREDINHSKCLFLGWYLKPNQQIKRSDPDFERYGVDPPSKKEMKRINEVREKYNWNITPEQLAWVRRKMDPTAKAEGDAKAEYVGSTLRLQEQPWTEEDAFQMTGATFFDPPTLTEMANKHVNKKFKTYSYAPGIEFSDCKIYPAHNARSVELKVWEEPEEGATYVVSADVAFGINEKNDRSAVQVLRCYADGLDQVAEYAWPLINSRAFGWVIASLLGWYAGETADVYLILELNGPGEATWNELQSLKRYLAMPYEPKQVEEKGLRNIFRNVKSYIYTRSDSMSAGHALQFKTTTQLKVTIMERLRDFVSNGMLHVRSLDTIEEMRSVARDGDSIEAQGSKKDDRVMSLALGVHCWEAKPRRIMMAQKLTRENVIARKRLTVKDQYQLYNTNQLQTFFDAKRKQRVATAAAIRRASWRSR
jgi:hypothetical protein